MKKLTITLFIFIVASFTAHPQNNAAPDSISTTLNEVVVTADPQIETAKKVTLTPSKLEKRHSTNGYTLLANMNLPYFNVNPSSQTISTITGRDVKILVNGVEVTSDEIATLSASEIVQIAYQRDPGGIWAGSGAVINFITEQYDYGGNLYLSAEEGLARQYGGYTAMANHKKKAVTLTLTANGKWDNDSRLNSAANTATLTDGILYQTVNPVEARTRQNSQYLNFKFNHTADNHTLDISALLKRNATPENFMADEMAYSGLYDFTSQVTRCSRDHGILPAIGIKYNLLLPGGHTLIISSEVSHGHSDYKSLRTETGFDPIINNAEENSLKAGGTVTYFKSLPHGLNLGASIDEFYNYFHDGYSGDCESKQTLANNHAMVMLHIDQTFPSGIYYYLSAGLTDLYSTIGNHNDNQLSPMAFYGLTYSINRKHAVSITGNYAHSIYDPSYKNDAVIRSSFFEATIGNPGLRQLNAFQNFISYNGRAGSFGFSFTYDFLKYLDNTSNRYFSKDNILYRQLVNDGNFCYNKLILGVSANLFANKLQLKVNATYSINRFNSKYRPAKSNDWRADFSASYMFGHWQIKAFWASPYDVLSIEGTKVNHPAQYGISLNWQRGRWAAACSFDNILDRRLPTCVTADYGPYRSVAETLSDLNGRNISLSITYILPYGKKTDRERVNTENKINSAILRPF